MGYKKMKTKDPKMPQAKELALQDIGDEYDETMGFYAAEDVYPDDDSFLYDDENDYYDEDDYDNTDNYWNPDDDYYDNIGFGAY